MVELAGERGGGIGSIVRRRRLRTAEVLAGLLLLVGGCQRAPGHAVRPVGVTVEPLDPRSLRTLNVNAENAERKAVETYDALRQMGSGTMPLDEMRKMRASLAQVREDAVESLRTWSKRPEFDESREHMARAVSATEKAVDYLDALIAERR